MTIKTLAGDFSVCKVSDYSGIGLDNEFVFTAHTDEEKSLVCPTQNVPANTIAREDGWRAFRVQGVLDFSLIGVIAEISALLADNRIGIFVISTYNTDYIFVKKENISRAASVLSESGYEIV